jgi:peroxiredoxin
MADEKKQTTLWPAVLIATAILAFAVIWSTLIKKPDNQLVIEDEHQHNQSPYVHYSEKEEPNKPVPSLKDVIAKARTWTPIFQNIYGKEATDFSLTDINGKTHRLSDYRGRDVLIIFWATWCRPCLNEIPHLIALRKLVSADKLAMLAISTEPRYRVESFAKSRKLNYTVIAQNQLLPQPYLSIRLIPSSFFINPDGKIKLVTEGPLSLGEIKAILQAP